MSHRFIEIDRRHPITLPGNLAGWLDGNDWAPFLVAVVEALDTRALEAAYQGGGSAPYPPKRRLALRCYGYAKGIVSRRKIERATDELIPVLSLPGGTHPDQDRINPFRHRFVRQVEPRFVPFLRIAQGLGILKRGDVSRDGTQSQAKASQPQAKSWA